MNYRKLKHSAEKITMPDDMKQRIIRKCESSAVKGSNDSQKHQVEHVFQVEHVQSHPLRRAAAGIAACAVLAGGIGYGHYLTAKNGTPDIVQYTDMSQSFSPFGDFRKLDYYMGDGRWDSFPQAKRDLISDFLNRVEWTYFADSSYYDEYLSENNRIISIAYSFFIEENGEYRQGIEISTNGIVRHWRIALENGVQSGDPLVDEFYKVDIEAFTDGMEKILRMYIFGDFSQLDYCLFGDGNLSSELSESQKSRLTEYLNGIVWTATETDPEQYENIRHEYLINITGENYYTMLDIYPDGTVRYRKQKLDEHRQPVGNEEIAYYIIDTDDFRENIEKILKVSPFGGFRDIDYNIMGHEDISPEQRDRVSDLLNGFEWGETVSVTDFNDEISDYMFVWNTDDCEMWLQIFPEGYARYQISSRTQSGAYHTESQTFYKIDTEKFAEEMEEILSENKEDEYTETPDEYKDIPFGMLDSDFNIAVVRINNDITETNLSAEKREKICQYLNYDIEVAETSPRPLGNDYDDYILRYASNDYLEEIYVYDNLIVYHKLPLNTPDDAEIIDSEMRYYSTDLSREEIHNAIAEIIGDNIIDSLLEKNYYFYCTDIRPLTQEQRNIINNAVMNCGLTEISAEEYNRKSNNQIFGITFKDSKNYGWFLQFNSDGTALFGYDRDGWGDNESNVYYKLTGSMADLKQNVFTACGIAPFGDLRAIGLVEEYTSSNSNGIDGYSKERLAEYFNSLEWNEIESPENDPQNISWSFSIKQDTKDKNETILYISPDNGGYIQAYINGERKAYDIDYDSMNKTIGDIFDNTPITDVKENSIS